MTANYSPVAMQISPLGKELERRKFFKLALLTSTAGFTASVYLADPASATTLPLPKLLKDCTESEVRQRMRLLEEERKIYVWSVEVENVEGIPMADFLPLGENPSVDWLIEFLDNYLELLTNLVDSVAEKLFPESRDQVRGISMQVYGLSQQLMDKVIEYKELAKKYESRDLHAGIDLADRVILTAIVEALLALLALAQKIRRDFFHILEEFLKNSRLWITDIGAKEDLVQYKDLWGTMEIPIEDEQLHDDDFFANTRLAGPNPMVIRRADSLPQELELDEAKFAAVAGEGVAEALAAQRLYILNYSMLGDMAKPDATFKILTGDNYNTAPIALFVRPEGSTALKPIVIQVGQERGISPVFYPPEAGTTDGNAYWGWQMAKTVVQTADFNHHEMFSHLAQTHLVSEAFCIATHRQLPPGHPLRELLEPHFEGSLYINNLAAAIIMGPYTMADQILAPAVHELAEGAANARLGWNFQDRMPHNDFADRGMDDPELEYPYREDALQHWEELQAWVSDYVDVYYASDADVAQDSELHDWTKEIIGQGQIDGFTRPTTLAELKQSVSMIIFTASVQHAAVNYLQRDQMTFAPHYAGTLANLPDKPDGNYTETDWFNMLPTFLTALSQMYFLNILGSVYYRRLGDYRRSYFPHPPALTDERVQASLQKFHQRLGVIESEINARNEHRMWPYPYLLPSNVPMSTNI